MAQIDNEHRTGTVGWRQFLTERKAILDAYDAARVKASARRVRTAGGVELEGAVRDWLSRFLPKRYGVCAGYIISQASSDDQILPHYDVVIYDQLESPVLWTEGHTGVNERNAVRAIPAEHVRAVIEVKSSFDSRTVREALKHLRGLDALLQAVDKDSEPYPRYLPHDFHCSCIFGELRKQNENQVSVLETVAPYTPARGFSDMLILRADGAGQNDSARVLLAHGNEPHRRFGRSLLGGCLSEMKEIVPGVFVGTLLSLWNAGVFAEFAFDLLARLQGRYRPGHVSSFHGMSWIKPA